MKKIILILTTILFTGILLGQQTLKVNLAIQKTTPTLLLVGSTPTINFNSVFTLIGNASGLTMSTGIFKIGTDTLATKANIRTYGTAGSMVYPLVGIAKSTGTGWATSITDNSSNWNTAYADRLKWDGGATGLTPSAGRTSLGASIVGSNIFTLTNPSAISFIRINADNTITARSVTNTQVDLGIDVINATLANSEELSVAIPALTGVPIPKLSTSAINAISTPAEGLLVYDLTLHVMKFYNGSVWKTLTTN